MCTRRTLSGVEGVRAGNVISFGMPGRKGKEFVVVVAEVRGENYQDLVSEIKTVTLESVGIPANDVVLVPPSTLPKTSSGKLQRSLCRQQYESDGLARLND